MPTNPNEQAEPRAPQRPHTRQIHGTITEDPWFWLRDRNDPQTIEYLEAENAFADAQMGHLDALADRLFEEIKGRVKETDMSVPVRKGPWWYVGRTEEGKQYPIHTRRADIDGSPADEEQILLDENELAADSDYLAVGDLLVSPDHRLLAYTFDFDGDEKYELRIVDLETGETLADQAQELTYGLAWSGDSSTIFYTLADEMQRSDRVVRHTIGTPVERDEVVFHETDDRFWVGLGATRSERFIVISSESKTTSEVSIIDADDPTSAPRIIEPRRQDHEYKVEHHGERFLILSNHEAPDFRMFEAPIHSPSMPNWTEIMAHEPGVRLDDVDAFEGHIVITRRRDNVPQVTVWTLRDGSMTDLEFPEPIFETGGSGNAEFDSTVYRFGYASMVTPSSIYEQDLVTGERTLLKQQEVLGGYDAHQYVTERLWAPASDGTHVPVSVVRHRDTPVDGSAPCVLYGYGSYEVVLPAAFSSNRLSLLNRGVVYAMAHVRGGGELGRAWYDQGRLADKINSFTDMITAVDHLEKSGWAAPGRIVIRGGSAGGLLVGAVMNMIPDRLAGVVAEVPFVDNVNTMLDPTLPLTIGEYEEWGNPEEPEPFGWMSHYSPYENVGAVDYPPVYATAGLNDPRVSYWEPAKWIAKLRTTAVGRRRFILKTEMGAGHGGPSGRYDAWRDEARIQAFVLDVLGLAD
ncbi:MAG: S9 family peptidase [Acidimicrobiales bacterium]|nr:S9 family peptidase [Acidimicrobiales bacterium]